MNNIIELKNNIISEYKNIIKPDIFLNLLQENKELLNKIKDKNIYYIEEQKYKLNLKNFNEYIKLLKKFDIFKNEHNNIKKIIFKDVNFTKFLKIPEFLISLKYINDIIIKYKDVIKIKYQNELLKNIIKNNVKYYDYFDNKIEPDLFLVYGLGGSIFFAYNYLKSKKFF